MVPNWTLGELVAAEQIVPWIADALTDMHRTAATQAKIAGKPLRLVVMCTTCTATKTCCSSVVLARFYEGVVIADRLVRTGRDTPELRAELLARAVAMESTRPEDFRTPCAFLDAGERCTIYDVRPGPCGLLQVYTDPTWCTTRAGDIKAYVPREEVAMAIALEEAFRTRLALRRKVGRRYIGVLPRMVLVALEAWNRADFRDHLRLLPWPDDDELRRWGAPD